nr:MAG TPA: hypothetical protein [Caudoviricetes sp.]
MRTFNDQGTQGNLVVGPLRAKCRSIPKREALEKSR